MTRRTDPAGVRRPRPRALPRTDDRVRDTLRQVPVRPRLAGEYRRPVLHILAPEANVTSVPSARRRRPSQHRTGSSDSSHRPDQPHSRPANTIERRSGENCSGPTRIDHGAQDTLAQFAARHARCDRPARSHCRATAAPPAPRYGRERRVRNANDAERRGRAAIRQTLGRLLLPTSLKRGPQDQSCAAAKPSALHPIALHRLRPRLAKSRSLTHKRHCPTRGHTQCRCLIVAEAGTTG